MNGDRRKKKRLVTPSQCLTRSKKRDENDGFNKLPLDLKLEILVKMPAKSIVQLALLSKFWLWISRGKNVIDLYLRTTPPRFLFVIDRRDLQQQFCYSCSQEDPSADHKKVHCYAPGSDDWYDFSPPSRGLILCQEDSKVMVGNPTTGQYVTLPRVQTRKKKIFSFFGYDPLHDVYKVLCMTLNSYERPGSRPRVSEEHQVFTLGAKQKWRSIVCEHPHFLPHRTRGICINGTVYYLARINDLLSLICFDLRYESFSVINLPADIRGDRVANYRGKIAVTNLLVGGQLDLWVLQDAGSEEWLKVPVLFPSWRSGRCLAAYLTHHRFEFKGTLSTTGELIFAPESFSPDPFFLVSYNLNESVARKVVIEGIGWGSSIEVYLDHVESPMVLPKLS